MGPMNKTGAKKRALSTAVVCPIVYGSVAVHLGKKSEEYSTHRWKLYIRGPNNEDLSTFVEKVAFTLHPSFAEPVREVKKAPFEVSETGWGEFEASIRIYFKDSDERPLDLFHLIKLYPPGPPQLSGSLKKPAPVVSEQYDEVVFFEPTESFLHLLMAYTAKDSKQQLAPLMIEGMPVTGTGVFDDSLDLERLSWIQDHVLSEINAAKDRLVNLQAQVVAITQQRRAEQKQIKAQQSQQQQPSSGEGSAGQHQQQLGDGGEDGMTESGFSASGSKAGGGGAGVTAVGKATPGAGVKAGTKAGAGPAGSGAGASAKRARPSASTAAVSAISSNFAAVGGQQQQQQQQYQQPLQQHISVAPGSVSKKVLGAVAAASAPSSSTAFAAPLPLLSTPAAPQSYQQTQQPHHFPQQQQQMQPQQQQQQQQPMPTQSTTFAPPPAQLQHHHQQYQQYQPQLLSPAAAVPSLGQLPPQMGSNSNVPVPTTATTNNPDAAAVGYSNNGNWPQR